MAAGNKPLGNDGEKLSNTTAFAEEVSCDQNVDASARAIIADHVRRDNAGTVVSGVVDFNLKP